MHAPQKTFITLAFLCLLMVLPLTGCQGSRTPATPTPPPFENPTPTPLITPTDLPTPTAPPPTALLVATPGTEATFADQVQALLSELSQAANLQLEVRTALQKEELTSAVRLVVVLGDLPGLGELAQGAPGTQFLVVGGSELPASANLTQIISPESQVAQMGFVAGYLAAVVTPDWRIGLLLPPGSTNNQTAQAGFKNGATYFCGLCRPARPPFLSYPFSVETAAEDTPDTQANTLNLLSQQAVQTVYITPGAGNQALYESLAQAGNNLIGHSTPVPSLKDHWLASIEPDYLPAIRLAWDNMLAGRGNQTLAAALRLTNVNETLFSPGRQRLVNDLIENLKSGQVDPGVEP